MAEPTRLTREELLALIPVTVDDEEYYKHQRCVRCADLGVAPKDQDGSERYSLGVYAGRYCDRHWSESGYRQEGREGFDPDDAGESYDED